MTPKTASTPWSPRLVTVMVGSDSSELRSLSGAGPVDEIAEFGHQLIEIFLVGIVNGRGDESPWRSEIATPT